MNKNKNEPSVEELLEGTEAGKIWEEIKNKDIQMFSLANRKVLDFCKPAVVEPTKLYLLTTASSVLPALEMALGPKYQADISTKYLVISRAPERLF